MAIGDIFQIPMKKTINASMQSKSFMIVGHSKSGKSTLASQAPRPIFLMTENGAEDLIDITPVPIASWADFKMAITQLCSPAGRENFDTVVIDTYTNLITLLDKHIGTKLTTSKASLDFASDAEYGKGTKSMRAELGYQLQRLANQGYIMLNIVHAEDKVDFDTNKPYIGTSLSGSLYGVAEKFVDQIVFLKRVPVKGGQREHRIYFNEKGGFPGTGGRWTPEEDYIGCSYENLEKVMLKAIEKSGKAKGATLVESNGPAVLIEETEYNFSELMSEFKEITNAAMEASSDNGAKIKTIVERELGAGRKASDLSSTQAELLSLVVQSLKNEFENETEKKENE